MRYVRLGTTGLQVSALALGCYAFGDPARGRERWTLPEERARDIIRSALDAGVTFFDTANAYSDGDSERVLGRAVRDLAVRDEIVLATKVWAPVRPGPNGRGLSRTAILTEIDASLRRLGTDHVDLYQVHRFDPDTPLEETMEALHDVVRTGKVRYLGASSMAAWQFATAQHVAQRHGWTRFSSMQNQYNLLHREEEREMLPLCRDQGVGVLPWSPLARGLLARPAPPAPAEQAQGAGAREAGSTTGRDTADPYVSSLYGDAEPAILDRVGEIAQARGVSRAQVALAWLAARPGVTAPIIGASSPTHLTEAVAALDLALTPAEEERLEEPYRPRTVRDG